MMRSANPTLKKETFAKYSHMAHGSSHMTIDGTVNKSFILFLLVLLTSAFTWSQFFAGTYNSFYMYGGLFGGLILAIITVFKKEWSPVTAPLYALAEGLFLGGISAMFESMFPGIVIQAVGLTLGTFLCLLFAYKSRLIKATENFKLGIVAATGGVFLIYMVSMIMGFFGKNIPYIHESGLIGIGFSAVVVVIAALNLVLDFDFIEHAAEKRVPKFMEWYAAFGLLVTLIWLYLEFLRLLAKIRSRD